MFRFALCALAALLSLHSVAASASVPVPTPKPGPAATADPQAAIARLMNEDTAFNPAVAAYAPARSTELVPRPSGEVSLYLVAKLSAEGQPISSGVVWRVFRDFPGADGDLPLIHKADGGDLELRLKADRYIVHASYGRAAVSRTIDLRSPVTSETLVLNAGGLQLDAVLDADGHPVTADARFDVYMIEGEARRSIGQHQRGHIARLPAGAYHVVSRYGGVNAVRSADVIVEAGKLTRVSLRHQAGTVRLKLVRDEGGEALADTAWTVFGPNGEPIFERVGAHANVTLAAGEYAIVARHRDATFSRTITVESGDEAEIEVLADRL